METIYLVTETGKEDYYELVGTREDLEKLKNSNEATYVLYPGSDKTVGVSFRETENPKEMLKKQIAAGKRSEKLASLYFFLFSGLAIYGAGSLLSNIVGAFK